jgi:hypothetical protein
MSVFSYPGSNVVRLVQFGCSQFHRFPFHRFQFRPFQFRPFQFSGLRCLQRWILCCVVGLFVLGVGPQGAVAGPLGDRIDRFPDWQTKSPILAQPESLAGDLIYPNWFAGTWQLTSTLNEQFAPLAPDVVTPGFEGNRQFLNKPVTATVRFIADSTLARSRAPVPLLSLPTQSLTKTRIIADRAFNGLSLAKAYLGDQVFRVWIDTRDPNRQVTKFRDNRKLFSSVVGRAVEQGDAEHFTTTEVFDQFFQTATKPVKNQVETTTTYTRQPNGTITATQLTAVYLVPPHPKAYLAGDRPVALYRYQLALKKSGVGQKA